MKKVLLIGLCVIIIPIFSFFKNAQLNPIKKIGKNLYQAKSTTWLHIADQEKLKAIIARKYGIRFFTTTIIIHYFPEKGPRFSGYAIADQKLGDGVFTQTLIEDGADIQVLQRCIYTTCSTIPEVGDIVRVLSNYNVR
jgi:hypothetical protein